MTETPDADVHIFLYALEKKKREEEEEEVGIYLPYRARLLKCHVRLARAVL